MVGRIRRKFQRHVGTRWEYLVLFLFVSVPIPGTGAYTGSLIAWLFKLKRRKSILTIALAVITAGILVTLIANGVFSFLIML